MKSNFIKNISMMMAATAVLVAFSTLSMAAKPAMTGVININTAPVEELVKLSGIGKSKAEAIIAYRQAHPFKSVAELTEVKGIGPKMLEKIQSHITVDGTVNAPVAASQPQAKLK